MGKADNQLQLHQGKMASGCTGKMNSCYMCYKIINSSACGSVTKLTNTSTSVQRFTGVAAQASI